MNVVQLLFAGKPPRHAAPPISAPATTGLWLRVFILLALGSQAGPALAQESPSALEEVTVTATLLQEATTPVSATVFSERLQRRRGAAHLEDVITLAPNVTHSSGASRSRFFQIRGVGERSGDEKERARRSSAGSVKLGGSRSDSWKSSRRRRTRRRCTRRTCSEHETHTTRPTRLPHASGGFRERPRAWAGR